jgi:hypothetical protein
MTVVRRVESEELEKRDANRTKRALSVWERTVGLADRRNIDADDVETRKELICQLPQEYTSLFLFSVRFAEADTNSTRPGGRGFGVCST